MPRRTLSTPDQQALGDSLPDLSIDDMLDIHELTMRACQTRMSIFAQQLEAIKEKRDVAIVTRWQTGTISVPSPRQPRLHVRDCYRRGFFRLPTTVYERLAAAATGPCAS